MFIDILTYETTQHEILSRHASIAVSRLVPLCLPTWPSDERDLDVNLFFYFI